MAESLCAREGQSAGEEPTAHLSFSGVHTADIYFPTDNTQDYLHYEHTDSKWCFVLRERGEIFSLCFQKGTSEPMWQASCLAAPCAIS